MPHDVAIIALWLDAKTEFIGPVVPFGRMLHLVGEGEVVKGPPVIADQAAFAIRAENARQQAFLLQRRDEGERLLRLHRALGGELLIEAHAPVSLEGFPSRGKFSQLDLFEGVLQIGLGRRVGVHLNCHQGKTEGGQRRQDFLERRSDE